MKAAEKRVVIDLPIDWSYGKGGVWKTVKAEIVDIAPHLAHLMTFAVHRHPILETWQVSNVETGFSVFRSETHGNDKRLVLDAVKRRLAEQSSQKCAKKLAALSRSAKRRGK